MVRTLSRLPSSGTSDCPTTVSASPAIDSRTGSTTSSWTDSSGSKPSSTTTGPLRSRPMLVTSPDRLKRTMSFPT